jgi:hypothetical protein
VVPPRASVRVTEGNFDRLSQHTYVYEAAPSLKWIALTLGAAASAVFLFGLGAEIQGLRASPRAASSS